MALKLIEKAFVVDFKPKGLGGRVEIGTVNKQCDLGAIRGHNLKLLNQINSINRFKTVRESRTRTNGHVADIPESFLVIVGRRIVFLSQKRLRTASTYQKRMPMGGKQQPRTKSCREETGEVSHRRLR